MSVEAYSWVYRQKPVLDPIDKGLIKSQGKWAIRLNEDSTTRRVNEAELSFCHVKLIQPKQKGKSVPVPRWSIIHDGLFVWDWDKYEDSYDWKSSRIPDYNRILVTFNPDLKYLDYDSPIEDKRVQLWQIRLLFPETEKMPMPIALDYVRDRL